MHTAHVCVGLLQNEFPACNTQQMPYSTYNVAASAYSVAIASKLHMTTRSGYVSMTLTKPLRS